MEITVDAVKPFCYCLILNKSCGAVPTSGFEGLSLGRKVLLSSPSFVGLE